jgi:carbon-monoxide dehydrogenase large subunit
MTTSAPIKFGMGAATRRTEDATFVRGAGRYTADVTPPGTLYAAMVRSTAAHARIAVSGLDEVRALDGVRLVWTAADTADLGTIPCEGVGPTTTPFRAPPFPILVGDVVRHVGDAIAFIVADDAETARSAGEMIGIDYDPLPVIADTASALDPDAPLVYPERGTNLAFEYDVGDKEGTDAAFASAAKVAELTLVNNRLVCNYMEPRAVVASFDEARGRYEIVVCSQGAHGMRNIIAGILKVRKDEIHLVTPDVGGGFGTKNFVYREYPLVARAAKALGRPVKWVSDRSEHFLADAQGRDQVSTAAFALDGDGRILAMRVETIASMGAYISQYGPYIPWGGVTMTAGLYDVTKVHHVCRGVFSNQVPTDAYRGAGRPEAAYLVERLADEAALVAGLSPEEFRRRNFIRPEQMPYRTATDRTFDSGEFEGHMDRALAEAGWNSFEARLSESRAAGRVRGIGFSTYIEACAFPGSEPAKIILEADGGVTLHIGTQSNGQGHATAYAQFIAGPLGLDYDRIRVVQGDTDALPTGGGTGGSRSIPLGVPSVDRAARKLADTIRRKAAEELEAGAADIELVDGAARIAGTDRAIGFADLLSRAPDKSAFVATETYETKEPTFPNGTHVCEVEIDPDTGSTHILRYLIVDDFGATVNPMLLAGQIHGGVAQGVGQALLERTVYDEDGQLITATFNDYAMPRAYDLPYFEFETRNVPSKHNAMGIKGAGEAGTVGSAPAVMNAVVDALRRAYGITHIDMPATPERVWNAIRGAGAAL